MLLGDEVLARARLLAGATSSSSTPGSRVGRDDGGRGMDYSAIMLRVVSFAETDGVEMVQPPR